MRYLKRALILLAIVAVVVVLVWQASRSDPISVSVVAASRGDVESIVANTRAGTVHAHRRARLSPSIGGQVSRLLVKEGDRVRADQVLLELWNADLGAELERARREAERATAKADETCERAELAEREAERLAKLKDLTAEERLDRARSEAKALAAAGRAARAQALAEKARIAQVEAALERTVLKAPFAGIVAEVNAELGEFVTPSPTGIPTPPTIDLIDATSLYVKAPIDEVDAPAVRPGMRVRIKLDAFGKRTFEGKVRRVAPYVLDREKQARTVDVEVDFADVPKDAALLPGYSADVEIFLETRKNVLRVPTQAVLEGSRVLLLDSTTGLLVERAFEAGIENWQFTEVMSGLAEGDRVVITVDKEGVVAGAEAAVQTEPET